MLGNYLQQTTSAEEIFRCIFFGALRVRIQSSVPKHNAIRRPFKEVWDIQFQQGRVNEAIALQRKVARYMILLSNGRVSLYRLISV